VKNKQINVASRLVGYKVRYDTWKFLIDFVVTKESKLAFFRHQAM